MRYVTIKGKGIEQSINVPETEDWNKVVDLLSDTLQPGMIFVLSGPLGAGKTTFVQALAAKLGVKKIPQSPTFALLRFYELPKSVQRVKRLIHVDAYRLENEQELFVLDLDEELADGKSVLLLEWPERVPQWIAHHDHVRIDIKTEA
jgi:tRNA threonylcarbamoyladenosine biosynthesis protein TsaE